MIYNNDFFKNKYPQDETYDFYISDDLKQIIPDNCFYELYRLYGREGGSCWNNYEDLHEGCRNIYKKVRLEVILESDEIIEEEEELRDML